MIDYKLVEEYFINVDKLFSNGEFAEGKKLLEEILEMEPDYGRAHNHLGWVYYAKLEDYKRAEYHYRLAKKFAPDYHAGYINLSFVLVETGKYDEARSNVADAMKVVGINKATLYNELGRIEELTGNYKEALKNYREAVKLGMNKGEIEVYNSNMERLKNKISLFGKRFFLF